MKKIKTHESVMRFVDADEAAQFYEVLYPMIDDYVKEKGGMPVYVASSDREMNIRATLDGDIVRVYFEKLSAKRMVDIQNIITIALIRVLEA